MEEEKRKFLRFDIPLNVEFKERRDDVEYFPGIIRNISREGFSIISSWIEYNPGTTLRLKIQLPHKEEYIEGTGEVIWKKQFGKVWQAGIRIKELNKEAKMEILETAYDVWITKSHHEQLLVS